MSDAQADIDQAETATQEPSSVSKDTQAPNVTSIPPQSNTTPDDDEKAPEKSFDEKRLEAKAQTPSVEEWRRKRRIADAYGDEDSGSGQVSNKAKFSSSVSGFVHTGSGDIYNIHIASQEIGIDGGIARISINKEYVSKARSVYLDTPAYHRAKQILSEKRIVVLFGFGSMGTHITATYLLQSEHSEEIYELDPRKSIAEFHKVEQSLSQGYVVNKITSEALTKLNRFELERLSVWLEAQQSHIVITVEPDATLNHREMHDYVVQWAEMPDRTRLLEKHLTWYLHGDEVPDSGKAELIQHPDVQTLLADLTPGKIDNLAYQLATVIRGEAQLDYVLSSFAVGIRQQIEEWFTSHSGLEDCVRMLTLAVLNGAKWQSISRAADDLLGRLKPQPREDDEPERPPLFDRPRSLWVKECHAVVIGAYEQTDVGECFVERIQLINPKYQREILDYVWCEYGHFHTRILDWLKGLVKEQDSDVRDCAAAAVGQLCKYDFEYVYFNVLLPWADEAEIYTQAAVAGALSLLSLDKRYRWHVQELLYSWSNNERKWQLCWTAAAIYGGYVGWKMPQHALRDLYAIIQNQKFDPYRVVRVSLYNLFQIGQWEDAFHDYILEALAKWSSKHEQQLVIITGLISFLDIAQEAVIQVESEEWPTLLWLSQNNQQRYETVLQLWRRAIGMSFTRSIGLEVLHQWLLLGEKYAYLHGGINRLMIDLIQHGTDREKERLRFHLRRWASLFQNKSALASAILFTVQ
jgi:hypothetical protein